jgi:DMSO/TMAO reductase YedYZ molybdopterin-dependent catalytic subunit
MAPTRDKILKLLTTADNFVKYAAEGREERGAKRARKRYQEAAALALRIGDEDLHARATLRLKDLDAPPPPAGTIEAETDEGTTDEGTTDAASAASLQGTVAVTAPMPAHAEDRVPPGQRVTSRWPVLHEGPIPRFDPATWRFTVTGATGKPLRLTYEELKAVGPIEMASDFHCVTGWSKLDNVWQGIQTKTLLEMAGPKPAARFVSVGAPFGYTANIPLSALYDDEAIVAWGHNGNDLAPKHGFPLRLVIPKLYAWKSVKWVESFELLEDDKRGFWELRGYHNEADPWREERYSYQER